MKTEIIYKNDKTTTVQDIEPGKCFIRHGEVYMKAYNGITGLCPAIKLDNGCYITFTKDAGVRPVNVTIIVEEEK